MNRTHQQRLSQLGMAPGTANARLRRALFWSLLVETKRTSCFRCDEPMGESNFSIDHKVPYLGADAILFWDLGNISYSHKSCNTAAARRPNRKSGPHGSGWCAKCQKFLRIEDLQPGGMNRRYCRVHYREYDRQWKAQNRFCRRAQHDISCAFRRHKTGA